MEITYLIQWKENGKYIRIYHITCVSRKERCTLRKKKTAALILLVLCLMLLFPCSSLGERERVWPSLTDGQLGENGVLIPGMETSLTVTVNNHAAPFQGLLSVDVYENQQRFIRYETPVNLTSNEEKPFALSILPQSDQPEYTVQLWAEDQVIASLSLASSPVQGTRPIVPGLPLSHATDMIPVENASSALPMIICLSVYLIAGILGGYFLLKKWNRRELMWGLIPALSLLCTLCIALIGGGQEYHTPAAVTLCIYDLDADQVVAGARVSNPGKQETALSSPGQDVSFLSHSIYTTAWKDPDPTPPQMTARYHQGENRQLILPPDTPWQTTNLRISNLPMENVALTGRAQPDEKGISGYVKNDSAHDFSVCAVFTPAGCTLLPPLKAGKSMEFSLPWGEYFAEKTEYQEGLLSLPIHTTSDDTIYYRLADLIQDGYWENIPYMHQQFISYDQRYALSGLMRNLMQEYWKMEGNPCLFIGLTDTLGRFPLAADEKEITRRGHLSAVVSHLEYQAAGDDGTLLYLPGTISPTLASLAENILQDTGTAAPAAQPAKDQMLLCYTFPGVEEKAADWLMIWYDDVRNDITYSAYNFDEGQWAELEMEGNATLLQNEAMQPFLQEGKMYLRIHCTSEIMLNTLTIPKAAYLGREK